MDFRPPDTPKIINTRNLIRVYALTNLFLVLLYNSIEPLFDGAHMSWLHQLHLILQPIAIFVSIADSSIFTDVCLLLSVSAVVFDSLILFLNGVAISRCIAEPTASCFNMISEKSIWALIALVHVLSDLMLCVRLFSLRRSLKKKDFTEKNALRDQDVANPLPSLTTVKVYCAKLRIIHCFLLPIGVIYVFFMLGKAWSNLLWFGALLHVFVDIYGISVSRVHDLWSLGILGGLHIALASINLFVMIYRIPEIKETISEDLSFYISVLYVFVDLLMLYFIASTFILLQKYERLKPPEKIN